MTLPREELHKLARETIAARHSGYRAALDALHIMQRQITPEMLIELVEDAQAAEPLDPRVEDSLAYVEQLDDEEIGGVSVRMVIRDMRRRFPKKGQKS